MVLLMLKNNFNNFDDTLFCLHYEPKLHINFVYLVKNRKYCWGLEVYSKE